MKFSWKGLAKPTPRTMRIVGSAFATISASGAFYQFLGGDKTGGMICGLIGLLGKLITMFYVSDDQNPIV